MAKYWPDKGKSATFGPITVTCLTEEERPQDTTVRIFLVSNARDKVRRHGHRKSSWPSRTHTVSPVNAIQNGYLKTTFQWRNSNRQNRIITTAFVLWLIFRNPYRCKFLHVTITKIQKSQVWLKLMALSLNDLWATNNMTVTCVYALNKYNSYMYAHVEP